ncbi:hypothetical protein HZB96_01395, partial [Candidatus Gottesmanbacteria bacterium]|nr:hypothetical protein [Candidatus Gottesmanbacteria bacterium]
MKKFVTIAGSVALMVAAVLPALAVGNNCSNGTTGPLSTNSCTVKNTSNVTVNNINDAQITNNVTARSNSGGNTASNNTLGGAVSTGNATLNATVSNTANINTTTVSGGPAASGNSGSNHITGPGDPTDDPNNIDNQVWIENLRQVAVDNNNAAVVNNTVNVTANTGENGADNNTG